MAGSPQYTVSCYCGQCINRNIALNSRRGFRTAEALCNCSRTPGLDQSGGRCEPGCRAGRGGVVHRVHIRVILMSPHISSRIFKKGHCFFFGGGVEWGQWIEENCGCQILRRFRCTKCPERILCDWWLVIVAGRAPKFLMSHRIRMCHLSIIFIDATTRFEVAPSFGPRTKGCAYQAMEKEVEK
jgi:hypothetical protein